MASKRLIVFRENGVRTREVVDTDPANIVWPDVAYEFDPQDGDLNAENYTHNGSFLQKSIPTPPPDRSPKPLAFVADCNADASLSVNVRQSINIMGLWLNAGARGLALSTWNQLKSTASAGQVAAIKQHATDNNVNLP